MAGKRFFSQHSEDGITLDLLARIGAGNPLFVEFGAGASLQTNTMILAHGFGWRGLWIERDAAHCDSLRSQLAKTALRNNAIVVENEHLTAENIDDVLFDFFSPIRNIGVMSIDVDGNDYWLWKAVESIKPRLVIIEYNASLGPDVSKTIPCNPNHVWDRTAFHGASLKALCKLGDVKGYDLVAVEPSGVNAYFALKDSSLIPLDPVAAFRPHAARLKHSTLKKQMAATAKMGFVDV